ncbi:hypothetical protein MLD38_007043 [Melastoma candidum]|uniref:Uncharacterized protein n=1 Tax=Melastoma candidum TaxID=119954 RepID=A0ACB9RPJ7_9MYRT|nr:hypothetical protein MLD38_007043 [Melastoma candidum]
MAERSFFLFLLLLFLSSAVEFSASIFEDQVGLMDWHQKYIGKVNHAVFHTQKTGRKRVVVSTEENVLASLDLRHGDIFWRHVLGPSDAIEAFDIALGKYVITLSSGGSILRAWNLPDGQMIWESFLKGSRSSKSMLLVQPSVGAEKETVLLAFYGGFLHAVSSIDGEILWRKDLGSESLEIQQIVQPVGIEVVYALGFDGSSQFAAYEINARNGELMKHESVHFSGSFSRENLVVSDGVFVALDASGSILVTVHFQNGEYSLQEMRISSLLGGNFGKAKLLGAKLPHMFALRNDKLTGFLKVTDEGKLETLERINNEVSISDSLSFAEKQRAFALVQHNDNKVEFRVKLGHEWNKDLLQETVNIDPNRGHVENVFINNYIRTDRSYGFRALIVLEDHSLLLVQQGEVVWKREDGLASILDVTTAELPVEKVGVSVSKVEENLHEWLKGHILKLKGTLMLATPEDVATIQGMRLKNSEKSKITRDHNGFRKLLIVLTRSGKVFALHTGDGRIVWSLLLRSLRKSEACTSPTGIRIYPWQIPHHHALDENPSVLVVGRCLPTDSGPGVLSFIDAYAGKEFDSVAPTHSVVQIIPLPFTDALEQRLHLLIDANQRAHLYPRSPEALTIFNREMSNVYWYTVVAENGIIRGYAPKSTSVNEGSDEYCFDPTDLWSIVFPMESEKIVAWVTRKLSEVVHTQAKVIADQDVMYKYISKNLLFVATTSPKGTGEIGSATPDESSLIVYLIDTVTGRILHRMIHKGCQAPVHAVLSENWVVYHYFNLRSHRFEMSVIEIYDQSRADNKDVWKLVIGKHNLTSPVSSYSRPEVKAESQSYFFTHSAKAIAVTSTAKGITSRQLLIGTVGDQVLALDKRYLDPRRKTDPTQAEKEEGLIPLTDSLPIIPQSYVTHALKVEGLRDIITVPAKLESTTLVFSYGVDLFLTRLAPSRTYDSLTEDFSYALLLLTIVVLVGAIFATWILSEKKELREKWR